MININEELRKIIEEFRLSTVQSEEEIRSKLIVPLLNYLGYPSHLRADEFPVYGFEGRKKLPTKEADYVLFTDSDYARHRSSSNESISWVQQHSLLVVEAKKPGEMPEVLGQPQYYTVWTRAVAYFITDGYSFRGCMYEPISSDYEVVSCCVDDLPEKDEINIFAYYEYECRDNSDAKIVIVIDHACLSIPYDIRLKTRIIDLSFDMIFPMLSSEALSRFPGLDFDHLAYVVDRVAISKLDEQATAQLCQFELRTAALAAPYGNKLMEDAVTIVQNIISHRDWTRIAKAYGKAAMFQHAGISLDAFEEKRQIIESKFVEWISQKYALLSGTVDKDRPVLLSKVNSFIKRGNSKIALILMDGMSFENFYTIQRMLISESFSYQIESSFSFFPTVTSVARQSVFSGKLPMEHTKPFSLDNEEKQWMEYWMEQGYRKNEIGFFKTETPDIPSTIKVAGIIVNICDDLMHDELQGMLGLQQGLENWTKNMHLVHLLEFLQKQGFTVYMTADHGNTSAVAEGRFQKPGVLAEPASRRAVIYQSFTDAQELGKFTTERYSGTYLPRGFTAYLFDTGTSFGDRGKEYITHGGMTLEEAVVPFVKIGAYNG